VIPASDSIKEGYVLIGRHDIIPKIRKLVLRSNNYLIFMKYKKDIVVKQISLKKILGVQLHSKNMVCFEIRYQTKHRTKTLILETKSGLESSAWVDALRSTIRKLNPNFNEDLFSNSPGHRSRSLSDPPTPTQQRTTRPATTGKDTQLINLFVDSSSKPLTASGGQQENIATWPDFAAFPAQQSGNATTS